MDYEAGVDQWPPKLGDHHTALSKLPGCQPLDTVI